MHFGHNLSGDLRAPLLPAFPLRIFILKNILPELELCTRKQPFLPEPRTWGRSLSLFPLCGLSFLLSVASLSVNRPSGHVGLRWLSQVNSKLPKASLVLFSLKIPTREKWKGLLPELCFPQQIFTHSLVRRSAWVTDTL